MKPLIGLTPSYYEHQEMERSILGKSYTDSVQQAGGLPVLIPPVMDRNDLAQLIRKLDGIILTGGADLDPKYYGEIGDPLTPEPLHPRRAEHDRHIIEYVWEHKIPTLAICLGMQELNVFLGGSLYQDIATQIDDPLVHKSGDWFDARHAVSLEKSSQLYKLVGQMKVDTNSAHHQAVKKLADVLLVAGRSADGLIEALEPRDQTIPMIAVQWHPESETNEIIGLDLFKWLVSAASQ